MDREWLKSGMKESPELIAKRIFDSMPKALKKYFG
jgi:hypothetical protein